MAKVIMVGNYKGGSGKSQTAIEMAFWFAGRGKKVLALDLDHQSNFSNVLSRYSPSDKRLLADILIEGNGIMHEDISTRLISKGNSIDYIQTGLTIGRLDAKLPELEKEFVVLDAIATIRDDYDYIVIDTPPSADLLVTSALLASDHILITSQPSAFGVEGVAKLMRTIKLIQGSPRLNPSLTVIGILVTMFENTKDSFKTLAELKNTYGNLVLQPYIRKSTKVKESNRFFTAVQLYAPTATSSCDYQNVFTSLFNSEIRF